MRKNIITLDDLPPLLKEIYKPPNRLFFKGKLETLNKTCMAVVGTRRFSEYGEYITNKIIEELSVLDIAIVSGLAKGIDTIAHKAALENNIPTIAVLGSGLDNIYPRQNLKLAEKISLNGIVLSEYEPDKDPLNFHFPQRNRIISGLSIATLVIEAPEKSGALITAELALEQGREIFVIPGDVDRKNSRGILKILQNGGAYPVASGRDIIEIINKQPHLFNFSKKTKKHSAKNKNMNSSYKLSPEESEILSILKIRRSFSIDEIIPKTSISTKKLLSALSFLEIKKLIKTKDGKYLRRC